MGDMKKLCNVELHNLHNDQIKDDEVGRGKSMYRDEKCTQTLVGKPEGKRPLGRHRCKWEDNIKMDIKESGWEVVDWIHPAQNSGRLL
jgi:hypothetical protein